MGNIEKAISVTDYFVTLPPLKYFIVSIILLGIIFGILSTIGEATSLPVLVSGALAGMILLSFPALLSSFAIKLMIRKIPFKQIAATTFVSEIVYSLFYIIGKWLLVINPFYSEVVILLGAAIVFVLWYVVGRLIFVLKYRSLLFAVVQLLFHILALVFTSSLLYFGSLETSITKFYLSSFILLIAIYVFFLIINAPMKRNFGISSTDAISSFMAQWLYQEKELEDTFGKVGERVKTVLGIMSFKRKNDNIIFAVPYVHFGPFGNLGGSEFSYLFGDYISKHYNAKSFVFHGTVTHDLDPVASEELGKIIKECNIILENAKYVNVNVSLSLGKYEECFAESLYFNDSVFLGLTRAPNLTEDVNFGVGLHLMSEAEKFFSLALVVDQHNSETGQITSFDPGSHTAYNYMRAVVDSCSQKKKSSPLNVGVSEGHLHHQCFGGGGIKVAIFSTDPQYVLVYMDANGITPEYRQKLVDEIVLLGKKYGNNWHVAIYTTDTHQINNIRGVLNPVKEDDQITKKIKELCLEAMYDLQPAKFYAEKRWFEIDVLGAKQSIEIISTINSIIAVAKIIAPIILVGSFFAIAFLLGFV